MNDIDARQKLEPDLEKPGCRSEWPEERKSLLEEDDDMVSFLFFEAC